MCGATPRRDSFEHFGSVLTNPSCLLLCLFCVVFLSACGGGSGGGGSTTSSSVSGSFTLSVSPASLNLVGGMKAPVTVQVIGQGGFSGSVAVSAGGLPNGVTVSPASVAISSGSSGQLTLTAASNVATGNAPITINGAAGSLTAKATLSVTLNAAATPVARPFTTVGGGLARGFYDETRKLLFASNPFLNEVDVLSGQNLAVTARVSVPQPFGIDQMADGKTLVVGTLTQGIYTVDEDTLIVTPHLAPNFSAGSPLGVSTTVLHVPVAMANGKVLLLGLDVGVYLDYIYGGQYVVEWDSNTGVFTLFTYSFGPFFNLKRSADHKWAIFGGEAQQLYLYNSDSDTFTSSQAPVSAAPYGVRDVAANPNGTQFAVASVDSVSFYDSAFHALGTVTTKAGSFQNTNVQYSAYGSRLYWELGGDQGGSVVDAVDTAKFTELGDVPTVFDQLQNAPNLLWVDSAQRAFESNEGGVGIFDCTTLRMGLPNAAGTLPSPKSIPLNTAASVSFGFFTNAALPAGSVVTFGGQLATEESSNPLVVQAPSSSVAGPVDLVITQPDGETQLEPQEFSYGVDVAAATATLVPPTGNPAMALSGFGILNGYPNPPTSVTVAGAPVPNMAVPQDSPLTALEQLFIQLPNGTPGPADIAVTGTNGTGVLKASVTYIPSAAIVPANGLLQLIYDNSRDLIYALKSTEVDVLNPTSLHWQSPLLPGSGKGYVSMTLTPDGKSMLVVDSTANTLTILDPDNPTQQSVTMLPAELSTPTKVVATNTGKAFIANRDILPIEFDLATLTATSRKDQIFGYENTFAATPDGSHVVTAILNDSSGAVGAWNSSNDSFTAQWFVDGFRTDLAISPDGSIFAAITGVPLEAGVLVAFYDEQLHYLNATVYPDLAPPDSPQNLGAMFSPSGQTLIVPLGDSIDFFNSSTGKLRGRLLAPEPLPALNFPITSSGTIALDPTATKIYAISASGLTVLTLPEPVDQITPPVWPFVLGAKHSAISKSMTTRSNTLRRSRVRRVVP